MNYQKCVKDVIKEPDYLKWSDKNPNVIVIKFKRAIYRYAPRCNEIRKMIELLAEEYGKEKVEEDLNIKIGAWK